MKAAFVFTRRKQYIYNIAIRLLISRMVILLLLLLYMYVRKTMNAACTTSGDGAYGNKTVEKCDISRLELALYTLTLWTNSFWNNFENIIIIYSDYKMLITSLRTMNLYSMYYCFALLQCSKISLIAHKQEEILLSKQL